MTLFQFGRIKLHSGEISQWKIECDALTDEDLETLAYMGAKIIGDFSAVEGVPRGGLRFAKHLKQYITKTGPLLIVDDVLTTGNSMIEFKADRKALGLVIFNRSKYYCPSWIKAIFQFDPASFDIVWRE